MTVQSRTWRNAVVIEDTADTDKGFVDMAFDTLENHLRQEVKDVYLSLLGGKPVTLRFVGDIASPPWAEGLWQESKRLCSIVRQLKDGQPKAGLLRYYVHHELGHAIDDFSFGEAGERDAIMALMEPHPNGWGKYNGFDSYYGLPSESWANRWAEAACTTAAEPNISNTYDDDYSYKISDDKLDDLRGIVLAGEGSPPDPTDPDPCAASMAAEPGYPRDYYALKLMGLVQAALGRLYERVQAGEVTREAYQEMVDTLQPQ